jgi:hypothetical protein
MRTSPAVYPSRRNSLLLKQQKRRRGPESGREVRVRYEDNEVFTLKFKNNPRELARLFSNSFADGDFAHWGLVDCRPPSCAAD